MLAFDRFAVPAELPAGTWTGPWAEPGFEIHEVIPSWNAETPTGSLVEVELQARTPDGSETGWYALGRWTFDDGAFERTSVLGQKAPQRTSRLARMPRARWSASVHHTA